MIIIEYHKTIIILLMVVAAAGCVSDNESSTDYPSYSYENYTNNPISTNDTVSTDDNEPTTPTNTVSNNKYDASGYCPYVVDGDTIDVEGVGRIRLVGVNTPERGQPGYQQAKDYVKRMCLGKTVDLDIDDAKNYDRYGRVLAVVYVNDVNLNAELLKKGYAEIMYIPPSEFNPYQWT
ncbi:MAG: thermonuclease family protein [Methanobacteriaceae archaeon]